MPAADALTVHTALREQCDYDLFGKYVHDVVETTIKASHVEDPAEFRDQMQLSRMRTALLNAETFYVSPNMHTLVTMAAEDFPVSEPVLRDDAPAEVGFLWLPDPLVIADNKSNTRRIHGMLWAAQRVWLIGDFYDVDDWQRKDVIAAAGQKYLDDFVRDSGRFNIVGMLRFHWDQPMPTTVKIDTFPLEDTPGHTDEGVQLPRLANAETMAYLLATWRMMQQSMTRTTKHESEIPRPVRRRAERAHLKKSVTVIELRRRDNEGGSGGTGEGINYRTTVRGHWRRVWCGPRDGERYQRAVYIHPFWRGPEGAPVIIRNRVNALMR